MLLQQSLLSIPAEPVRTSLADGAWVEVADGWWPDADGLFFRLAEAVPWQSERRQMFDREVDVPRLVAHYGEGEPLPDPALEELRVVLGERYAPDLGEPFATVGLCLYRDGSDSVAWHGDTIGRGATDDTVVAILSLGSPRPLLLRPRSGGTGIRHDAGHGHLLAMGGSCQRTWEHAVAKTKKPVGPRLSVQYRAAGVR